MQHGRPEQRVEVADVLADEVVQFDVAVDLEERVDIETLRIAERLQAAEVADRRIEPDIEILAGMAGDLEAEVGRVARDVPILQARLEPFGELGAHRCLQRTARDPIAQHRLEAAEGEEEMFGLAPDGRAARERRARIDEISRRVGRAAGLAGIAVLVGRLATRAGPPYEAVREEHPRLLVVGLTHAALGDVARVLEPPEHQVGEMPVLGAMGGMEPVVADEEPLIVRAVLRRDAGDQGFGGDALRLGLDHDRRAVGVLGADVAGLVAEQLLEAHPDVGLERFDDVSEVQRAVGVGQGAGDKDAACHPPIIAQGQGSPGRNPLESRACPKDLQALRRSTRR